MEHYSFFEHDLAFDEQKRTSGRQATAAALARTKNQFGAFLENDTAIRFAHVEDNIQQIIAEVVDEYGGDGNHIFATVSSVLSKGGFCDDCRKWKSGPNAGCTCGSNKKDEPKESEDKSDDVPAEDDFVIESGWRIVAVDAQGDYLGPTKREKLPKGNGESIGNGPEPKMDKTRWKPNALNEKGNLPVIKTEDKGSRHPTEIQDIAQIADHTKDFKEQTKGGEHFEDLKGTNSFDGSGYNTEKNIVQYPTRTFGDKDQQPGGVTKEIFPNNKTAAPLWETQAQGEGIPSNPSDLYNSLNTDYAAGPDMPSMPQVPQGGALNQPFSPEILNDPNVQQDIKNTIAMYDINPNSAMKALRQTQPNGQTIGEVIDNICARLENHYGKAEDDPCWDGYHKVPGKKDYEEDSCEKDSHTSAWSGPNSTCPECGANPESETKCSVCRGYPSARHE